MLTDLCACEALKTAGPEAIIFWMMTVTECNVASIPGENMLMRGKTGKGERPGPRRRGRRLPFRSHVQLAGQLFTAIRPGAVSGAEGPLRQKRGKVSSSFGGSTAMTVRLIRRGSCGLR